MSAASADPLRRKAEPRARLLADIGGTTARFALARAGMIGPVAVMAVADHPTPADAIRAFLAAHPAPPESLDAVLAVAGPVENGRCALTNSTWVVDAAALGAAFSFASARLLNDFEALAWALPVLAAGDLHAIGGGAPKPRAPRIVLGPGTGFGAAAYVDGDPPRVLAGEGGHATLPAADAREAAVIERLRQRFGHVSIERALSGDGLVNLYQALAALDGATVPDRDAAAIVAAARDRACAVSRAALELFCALLGGVAGDLALSFGAQGGVYVGGGIAPRLVDTLPSSAFRARFEAKGRFDSYLRTIPTWIITHPQPALRGLATLPLSSEREAGS